MDALVVDLKNRNQTLLPSQAVDLTFLVVDLAVFFLVVAAFDAVLLFAAPFVLYNRVNASIN